MLKEAEDEPIFKAAWQRFQSLAIGVDLQSGIVVEAVAQYESANSTKLWSEFVRKTNGAPEFLKKVPRRAIAVFAGRYDPQAIAGLLMHATSEREQKKLRSFRQVSQGLLLGLDLVDDILSEMKTNWGIFVVAPEQLQPGGIPFDGLMAFELPKVAPDEASPRRTVTVRSALDNGLNTALNLLAAYYNGKAPKVIAIVRSDRQNAAMIRWIDSFGPYQPAYALTADYLIFASTPRLISEFINAKTDESFSTSVQYEVTASNYFSDGSHVLFVNVAALRELLANNKDFFVSHASEMHSLNEQAIRKKLERVDDIVRLIDTGFVAVHIESDRIRLILGGLVNRVPPRSTRNENQPRVKN